MNEMKKVIKWFWAWDFDKEEEWLNEMAMSGWALKKVAYCTFYFEKCEPGEYTIRLEMRDAEPAYIAFMEETGAEYVGSVLKWIYFRMKTEYGTFELHGDLDSKIEHVSKVQKLITAIGILNIMIGTYNCINSHGFGVINLWIGCLAMYGLGRVAAKKEQLQKERAIRE